MQALGQDMSPRATRGQDAMQRWLTGARIMVRSRSQDSEPAPCSVAQGVGASQDRARTRQAGWAGLQQSAGQVPAAGRLAKGLLPTRLLAKRLGQHLWCRGPAAHGGVQAPAGTGHLGTVGQQPRRAVCTRLACTAGRPASGQRAEPKRRRRECD